MVLVGGRTDWLLRRELLLLLLLTGVASEEGILLLLLLRHRLAKVALVNELLLFLLHLVALLLRHTVGVIGHRWLHGWLTLHAIVHGVLTIHTSSSSSHA